MPVVVHLVALLMKVVISTGYLGELIPWCQLIFGLHGIQKLFGCLLCMYLAVRIWCGCSLGSGRSHRGIPGSGCFPGTLQYMDMGSIHCCPHKLIPNVKKRCFVGTCLYSRLKAHTEHTHINAVMNSIKHEIVSYTAHLGAYTLNMTQRALLWLTIDMQGLFGVSLSWKRLCGTGVDETRKIVKTMDTGPSRLWQSYLPCTCPIAPSK